MSGFLGGEPVDIGARLLPAGAIYESLPSMGALANLTGTVLVSQTLQGVLMPLAAGQQVTTLTWCSGSTALATGVNQWSAILRYSDRAVLAKSIDKTTEAWGTDALKVFTFASPWVAPATDDYVACLLVNATTVPSLRGAASAIPPSAQEPRRVMRSTTGLTDPASLGATAAAFTDAASIPYVKAA